MNLHRLNQVLMYGWEHSYIANKELNGGKVNRLKIYFDMLHCYFKYNIWSNNYLSEKFHTLDKIQQNNIGKQYREKGKIRDEWRKDFAANRRFMHKYMDFKYELEHNREKRIRAYTKRYNIGKNLAIEYDVHLSRQHYLPGTISIGNNVLLAKHVFIDYSGHVVIKDNVSITSDVIILSHDHTIFTDNTILKKEGTAYQTNLVIEEGVVISSRAIILPTCNYIGKNSRIGAGAVVKNNVPDNTLVATKPAKMISF